MCLTKVERLGEHVHVRIFIGENRERGLGFCGELVMRVPEWHLFGSALGLGALQTRRRLEESHRLSFKSETESGGDEAPLCAACGSSIICAVDEMQPFTVIVRDPFGALIEGGRFCGGCMVELAKHGVRITP